MNYNDDDEEEDDICFYWLLGQKLWKTISNDEIR